ncbi:MAG: CoA transferase [Chloroflexi bacterium]|nr:CoA transferase [Chloroflexota bacterium]
MADSSTTPLAGIRVADLTHILSGPYCTMLLADLGADVIKVEEPTRGDHHRTTPPKKGGESAYFLPINRNKRSLALDLKSLEGHALFLDLIRISDVVVENFRPGALDRLGLGYEALAAVNPRIILCSISGFGQTGPLRDKTSYDLVAQAMSGSMSITGEPGRMPLRSAIPAGDISGGVFGALAVLAALQQRERAGRGQKLDVSMFDAMISFMTQLISPYVATGVEPPPVGSGHHDLAPYGTFHTADGYIVITAAQGQLWPRLCAALGRPELAAEPRFVDLPSRRKNVAVLTEELERILAERTTAEWATILDEAGIPNGPVLTVSQLVQHPLTLAREMMIPVEHPRAGTFPITGYPVKFQERLPAPRPAPLLGQHSREVLAETLGYGADRIEELLSKGVVRVTGARDQTTGKV